MDPTDTRFPDVTFGLELEFNYALRSELFKSWLDRTHPNQPVDTKLQLEYIRAILNRASTIDKLNISPATILDEVTLVPPKSPVSENWNVAPPSTANAPSTSAFQTAISIPAGQKRTRLHPYCRRVNLPSHVSGTVLRLGSHACTA